MAGLGGAEKQEESVEESDTTVSSHTAELDALAEQFEGQGGRSQPATRTRSLGGGVRYQSSVNLEAKVERMSRAHRRHSKKQERQKRLLDARAFKELDTTLQVLGIDGSSPGSSLQRVTASPHAPLQTLSPRPPHPPAPVVETDSDSTCYSSRSSSRMAPSGRMPQPRVQIPREARGPPPPLGPPTQQLRPILQGAVRPLAAVTAPPVPQPGPPRPMSWAAAASAPPRPQRPLTATLLAPPDAVGQPDFARGELGASPPSQATWAATVAAAPRGDAHVAGGAAVLAGTEDERGVPLRNEREEWRANLENLLEGDFAHEDLELAVSLARSKANDLREQLIYWATPPERTWPAREQRLDWLEFALMEARDIATGLRQHGALMEGGRGLETYVDIVKDLAVELKGMACLCCEAVGDGLRTVGGERAADTRRPFEAAKRGLHVVRHLTSRLRSLVRLAPTANLGVVITDLGVAARELVLAACDCAGALQEGLLRPDSLCAGVSGHEVSVAARQLQGVWQSTAELAQTAAEEWPEIHTTLHRELCTMYLKAAQLADDMQQHCRRDADALGLLSDDDVGGSAGTGVWGVPGRSPAGGSALADEDLQAQAWLPPCLKELLEQAEKAADALKHDGENGSAENPDTELLLRALSEAMYALAQTSMTRVSHLARSPQLLACWALEVLEEQACQALVFVRDLDRSILGSDQLQQGTKQQRNDHFKVLKRGTDQVVNSILLLRRLIKQKRSSSADGFDDGIPRPLPISRGESNASFTSTVSSLSSSMIVSRTGTPVSHALSHSLESPRSAVSAGVNGGLPRSSVDEPTRRPPLPQPTSRSPRTAAPAGPQGELASPAGATPPTPVSPASYHTAGSGFPAASPGGVTSPSAPPKAAGEPAPAPRARGPPSFRSPFEQVTSTSLSGTAPLLTSSEATTPGSRTPSSAAAPGGPSASSLGRVGAAGTPTPPVPNGAVHRSYTLNKRGAAKSPFEASDLAPFASQNLGDVDAEAKPSATIPSRSERPLRSRAEENGGGMSRQWDGKDARGGATRGPPDDDNVSTTRHKLRTKGRRGRHAHCARGGSPPSRPAGVPPPPAGAASAPVGGAAPSVGVGGGPSLAPVQVVAPQEKRTWKEKLFGKLTKVASIVADAKPATPLFGRDNHVHCAGPSLRETSGAEGEEGEARRGRGPRHPKFQRERRHEREQLPPKERPTRGRRSSKSDEGLALPWDGDPFWQIKWTDLQPTLVKKLGSGSFGQVYEAYFHAASMAVKIMTLDGDELDPLVLNRFKQEVDLQRRLSLHPNIVRFLGACCHIPSPRTTKSGKLQGLPQGITLAIVMELCRFGNLYKLIELARRVSRLPPGVLNGTSPPSTTEESKLKACPGWRLFHSWTVRLELLKQAAAAVEFMHSQSVVHRDLTSYNLLITDKWEAKVADFNLSRALSEETVPSSGQINSPEWSAPERLSGQAYGKAADVFSFGVVVWEMVTLGVPWREDLGAREREHQLAAAVGDGAPAPPSTTEDGPFRDQVFHVMNAVPQGSRLNFPAPDAIQLPLPEAVQVIELAQECWAQEPRLRPTMAAVCARMDAILSSVKVRTRAQKYGARA